MPAFQRALAQIDAALDGRLDEHEEVVRRVGRRSRRSQATGRRLSGRTIRPMATTEGPAQTDSGIEIKPVYTAGRRRRARARARRASSRSRAGRTADMYRGRPWTIRQYAGFASAEETNERFRYLLDRGQTGLSVAFDLPTQLGYDSDDPRAAGEVGRTGVAIDSLADMELLLRGDPARRGLDLDDDQRAGRAAPAALRARRGGAGRRRRASCAARCRTTSSRSTSRAGTTSSRRGRRCG